MSLIGKLFPGVLAGIGFLFLYARNCELEEELREQKQQLCQEQERRIKAESCLNRLKFNFEAMLIRSGRGENMTVYQKTALEEGLTYVSISDDTCLILTEDVPQNLR